MTQALSPTDEQLAALDMSRLGKSFKVIAYAGAGKTTTLKLISEALLEKNPRARGLYVAFNKAIATEASGTFPNHVDCRTFHSLAYRHVSRDITKKLSLPRLTARLLAKKLGLQPITLRKKLSERASNHGRFEFHRVTAAQQASMVADGLSHFCTTHASYPAPRHLQLPDWLHPDDAASLREHLYPHLEARWQQAIHPHDNTAIGHEIYLKLWALSKPQIPADFILFDEAQDADPLMLGILMNQAHAQVIYVGDAHQQIYAWRGATNAMKKLPLPETRLTRSFRFGQSIAGVANVLLTELGETEPLKGIDKPDAVVNERNLAYKNALLCRTNAGALEGLLAGLNQGHKVALQADTTRLTKFAEAAERLKSGKQAYGVPELALFNSWQEVQEYAELSEGSELKGMVKLIDSYGALQLKRALARLHDIDKADYVISTAHKAKGLEWVNVQIADDYLYKIEKGKLSISDEELRLLYVACTRAKNCININGIYDLITLLSKEQAGDKSVVKTLKAS